MVDGVEPEARTCERGGGGAGQSLSFALRVMVEAVLVEEFAGEGTDRRVETPRSAEKEASIGWNGVVLAEQVLESRGVAAPRMATLDGLLELLGIAEKHHISGGGAGDSTDIRLCLLGHRPVFQPLLDPVSNIVPGHATEDGPDRQVVLTGGPHLRVRHSFFFGYDGRPLHPHVKLVVLVEHGRSCLYVAITDLSNSKYSHLVDVREDSLTVLAASKILWTSLVSVDRDDALLEHFLVASRRVRLVRVEEPVALPLTGWYFHGWRWHWLDIQEHLATVFIRVEVERNEVDEDSALLQPLDDVAEPPT